MSGKGGSGGMPTACWVLTDGKIGMEVQCLGLAEALGFNPVVKRVHVTRPWRWLPPSLIRSPLRHVGPKGDGLTPPWPDVLIASGRQAVAPAVAIRRLAAGRTYLVQIQNPAVDLAGFDVVVAPSHDGINGPNVITTIGSMTRITTDRLADEARRFAARFAHLPRPLVAVCIGGDNRAYRLTEGVLRALAEGLARIAREQGAGLMVTLSRRTGTRNASLLRRTLADLPADVWDGHGDNPYFGMLGLADHIVVTCDSVNMVCEAASTGKPVSVVMLAGGGGKFARFHRALAEAGIARPFRGVLESWVYAPLDETQRVAEEIKERMHAARLRAA